MPQAGAFWKSLDLPAKPSFVKGPKMKEQHFITNILPTLQECRLVRTPRNTAMGGRRAATGHTGQSCKFQVKPQKLLRQGSQRSSRRVFVGTLGGACTDLFQVREKETVWGLPEGGRHFTSRLINPNLALLLLNRPQSD